MVAAGSALAQYRVIVGVLLVCQAAITWRVLQRALPEPNALALRFRYPGLPLAPLLFPPSKHALVAAAVQAGFGVMLAIGRWTAFASAGSLAMIVHLLLSDQSLYQNVRTSISNLPANEPAILQTSDRRAIGSTTTCYAAF